MHFADGTVEPGEASNHPGRKGAAMKRYYINHVDGMTRNTEFEEIRDRLLQENLIREGQERRRIVARSGWGQRYEGAFLHLFKTREEAEAFLERLKSGPDDRRWKVFEVDVVGPIDEILKREELDFPAQPKVLDIRARKYIDSIGDEAFNIVVTVEREPSGGETWRNLVAIKKTITQAVFDAGFDEFPYVNFTYPEAAASSPS